MHEGATSSGCISASLTVYELIRALHRVYVVYERVLCLCVCCIFVCASMCLERPMRMHAYVMCECTIDRPKRLTSVVTL